MGTFKAIKEAKNLVGNSNGFGDDAIVGRALVIDASLAGMAISMGADGRGSAATVLATGTPAEAVIVSNTPLGLRLGLRSFMRCGHGRSS